MVSIFISVLLGICALFGLILGAEFVVHAAKKLAKRLGISEFFIGLTLLSVLTSLPEITEHIIASITILKYPLQMDVLSEIALGTNIGSNIIQITLITGIVGLFGKLICDSKFLKKDYMFMLAGIVLLWVFSLGGINRYEGIILTLLYIGYIIFLSRSENAQEKIKTGKLSSEIFFIAMGFTLLIFCANYILKQAVWFSETYNISGSLIGTLIIGVATALPELTTAITALFSKSSRMSLGTLVGSNITNPMLAIGLGAMISGYSVSSPLFYFDIPFWFGISFLGLLLFWKGKYLNKYEAIILILSYFAYFILRLSLF